MAMYGTREYWEEQVTCETLKFSLLTEATCARLNSGKISFDELKTYNKVLDDSKMSLEYATRQLAEVVKLEVNEVTEESK